MDPGKPLTPSPSRRFLSPAEYAVATGLSITTVYRRIRQHEIPVLQHGGRRHRVLIPAALLDTAANPVGGTSPRPDGSTCGAAEEPEALSDSHVSVERLPGPKPRCARGRGRS